VTPLLEVDGLRVSYLRGGDPLPVLHGVSFSIAEGGSLALVGESGSGKSTVALALMGLIRRPIGEVNEARITLSGREVQTLDEGSLRQMRRHEIGYVPQDPTTALDPLFTIGSQVAEAMPPMSRSQRREAIAELLASLGVDRARERLKSYPHEFSGGMRQRVAIAIALAKQPSLIIADEPTTALDATTQVGILRLLLRLRRERGLSTLFITHDLAVARKVCEHVAVMYAGSIVEMGPIADVMAMPAHPYTRALVELELVGVAPRSRLPAIKGSPPRPGQASTGCPFAPRCPLVDDRCRAESPPLVRRGESVARCWRTPS